MQDDNIEPAPTARERIPGDTLAEYERGGRIVNKTRVTWD